MAGSQAEWPVEQCTRASYSYRYRCLYNACMHSKNPDRQQDYHDVAGAHAGCLLAPNPHAPLPHTSPNGTCLCQGLFSVYAHPKTASSEMLRKLVPLLYQGVSASIDRGASTAALSSGLSRLVRSISSPVRPWTALPLRGFAGAATQQQPDAAAAALTIDKSTTEVWLKQAVPI